MSSRSSGIFLFFLEGAATPKWRKRDITKVPFFPHLGAQELVICKWQRCQSSPKQQEWITNHCLPFFQSFFPVQEEGWKAQGYPWSNHYSISSPLRPRRIHLSVGSRRSGSISPCHFSLFTALFPHPSLIQSPSVHRHSASAGCNLRWRREKPIACCLCALPVREFISNTLHWQNSFLKPRKKGRGQSPFSPPSLISVDRVSRWSQRRVLCSPCPPCLITALPHRCGLTLKPCNPDCVAEACVAAVSYCK